MSYLTGKAITALANSTGSIGLQSTGCCITTRVAAILHSQHNILSSINSRSSLYVSVCPLIQSQNGEWWLFSLESNALNTEPVHSTPNPPTGGPHGGKRAPSWGKRACYVGVGVMGHPEKGLGKGRGPQRLTNIPALWGGGGSFGLVLGLTQHLNNTQIA